jgi:integrase
MSERKPSRGVIVQPEDVLVAPRNLLQVREAIQARLDLPARRRADYISALNTVGRLHLRPGEEDVEPALASLDAAPWRIIPHLRGFAHARHGIQRTSWNNVVSRVRKALQETGARVRDGRRQTHLTPEWADIFDLLPPRPFKLALGGFVSWCSEARIMPDQVSQDTFAHYETVLGQSRMRKAARRTFLLTRRTWNRAVDQFPHWPKAKFTVKYRLDHRYALPWDAFDPKLVDEVERRAHWLLHPDPTDERAPHPVKKVTADHQCYRIRRLASALVAATGRDPRSITSIANLVEVESARAVLTFILRRLKARDPSLQTSMDTFLLARFICTLAKHSVRVSGEHLEKLKGMARRLKPTQSGMRPKNRRMLREFLDEKLLARFLDLPQRHFERLLRKKELSRWDATKLSIAFAVALLTVAPVRPKNAARVMLERNIIQTGSGGTRRVHLHFPPEEVKNGMELEFELTGVTLDLFDAYVTRVRPLLTVPENPYLFPGRGIRSKGESFFSKQIADLLRQEIGVYVTAQQFRHLVGFIYLGENPGNYEVVRRFLGHKSIATTVKFYAEMEMRVAAKTLDDAISRRRVALANLARKSTRRRRG